MQAVLLLLFELLDTLRLAFADSPGEMPLLPLGLLGVLVGLPLLDADAVAEATLQVSSLLRMGLHSAVVLRNCEILPTSAKGYASIICLVSMEKPL